MSVWRGPHWIKIDQVSTSSLCLQFVTVAFQPRSEEEWKLVQVHVGWDVTNFTSVDGNFICKHAWGGDLDWVSPVIVVVAQGVGEIQDGILGDLRGVRCNVEMSWLDGTLGDRVRNKEEVEGSINDFWLLDESLVDVGTLRWIGDTSISTHLEESLSNSLVDNDQSVLWKDWLLSLIEAVLLLNDLVELLKLMADDLSSHWITNTISVDENVVWEVALIVVSEGLEGTLEVLLKNTRTDDLLTLLTLWTSLCVVFTHVLVVSGAETNNGLLTLMANINTNKHSLSWDLLSEVQSPQVTTKFSVDLSQDIDIDSIVVFLDGLTGNKLRNNWTVSVDLILQGSVEMLLLDGIWHDDKEEVKILGLSWLG